MYRSFLFRTIIMIISVSLLSGCNIPLLKKEEDHTIKIAYPIKQNFSGFEALLKEAYPDMKIEVIETKEAYEEENWEAALEELYRTEQPDLVYMSDGDEYDTYVENKWLTPLDDYDYPVDSVYPPVLDLLRLKDGSINGLARYFDTKLLFYNKAMFDSLGFAYPTEGMSWEDLLSISFKFAMAGNDNGQKTYGVEDYDWDENPYNPFRFTEMIGLSKGMHYIDSEGNVTINDPAWVSLFGQVADAYRSGAIYLPENRELLYDGVMMVNNYVKDKKFLSGETAMAVHRSTLFGYLSDIKNDGSPGTLGVMPFDWGVIPAPVDPSNPRTSSTIEVWDIFGIYRGSGDNKQSWNVLQLLVGKDLASTASDLSKWDKRSGERLSVFPEYIRKDGEAVGTFTNQELDVAAATLFDRMPKEFFDAFRIAAGEELSKVIAGQQTPEEAIANLQASGQGFANGYK